MAFSGSLVVMPPKASAQPLISLPAPGIMVTGSPIFAPPLIKGVRIFPNNPLRFDFIIDTGDTELKDEALREEADKMVKYFLATLTVPKDELWVNLSPYEKDRIIPDAFGVTEMGRDLLAQDYLLKQLTASLVYPEEEFGKAFWERVHKKAYERFGATDIPINTFNKVWILPQKAVVYENGDTAFVVESHLKVMLEQDYLALKENISNNKLGTNQVGDKTAEEMNELSSEIVREILIPEIEKEVNEGENFANLRQIYHAMILATWFKRNLRQSLLNKIYVDQNKVEGVDVKDKDVKKKIYQQYLKAFETGVYNYIKDEYDPNTQEVTPRKYFSGGAKMDVGDALEVSANPIYAAQVEAGIDNAMAAKVVLSPTGDGTSDFSKNLARYAATALADKAQERRQRPVDPAMASNSMDAFFNRHAEQSPTVDTKGYATKTIPIRGDGYRAEAEVKYNYKNGNWRITYREGIERTIVLERKDRMVTFIDAESAQDTILTPEIYTATDPLIDIRIDQDSGSLVVFLGLNLLLEFRERGLEVFNSVIDLPKGTRWAMANKDALEDLKAIEDIASYSLDLRIMQPSLPTFDLWEDATRLSRTFEVKENGNVLEGEDEFVLGYADANTLALSIDKREPDWKLLFKAKFTDQVLTWNGKNEMFIYELKVGSTGDGELTITIPSKEDPAKGLIYHKSGSVILALEDELARLLKSRGADVYFDLVGQDRNLLGTEPLIIVSNSALQELSLDEMGKDRAMISEKNILSAEATDTLNPKRKSIDEIQDKVARYPKRGWAVVADGMGGHAAGALAATFVVAAAETVLISERIQKASVSQDSMRELLTKVAHVASGLIARHEAEHIEHKGMGSTVTLPLIYEDPSGKTWLALLNIGDSRAYLATKDGDVIKLTRDDTWAQDLVDNGTITEEQAKTHHLRDVLGFAILAEPIESLEAHHIQFFEIEYGDSVYGMSDGGHENLSGREVIDFLGQDALPEEIVQQLLRQAMANRFKEDDIGAVGLRLIRDPITEQKESLRDQITTRLREEIVADPIRREGASEAILRQVDVSNSNVIATYLPLAMEPNTRSWIEQMLKDGKRVALPRTYPDDGNRMEFYEIRDVSEINDFEETPLGTLEPPENTARLVAPEQIDLITVPGLAFDADGNRLGRQGGYYDRYLTRMRDDARKIGVAFTIQMFELIPTEAHDVRLDDVITDAAMSSTRGMLVIEQLRRVYPDQVAYQEDNDGAGILRGAFKARDPDNPSTEVEMSFQVSASPGNWSIEFYSEDRSQVLILEDDDAQEGFHLVEAQGERDSSFLEPVREARLSFDHLVEVTLEVPGRFVVSFSDNARSELVSQGWEVATSLISLRDEQTFVLTTQSVLEQFERTLSADDDLLTSLERGDAAMTTEQEPFDKMHDKKVHIIGASSFLGRKLFDMFTGEYREVVGTGFEGAERLGFSQLDVTSEEAIEAYFANVSDDDIVIYAAGWTDVESAPENRERVDALNIEVVEHIAKHFQGKFVYISTDNVFSGDSMEPYTTDAETAPVNYYGQSKLNGERAALREFTQTTPLVVRLGELYGFNEADDRPTFARKIIDALERKEEINVDSVARKGPMLIDDVALGLLELLDNGDTGIQHLNGPQPLSKYEWALKIASIWSDVTGKTAKEILPEASLQRERRPRDSYMEPGFNARSVEMGTYQMLRQMGLVGIQEIPDELYSIGVSLGGTKIGAGLVSGSGYVTRLSDELILSEEYGEEVSEESIVDGIMQKIAEVLEGVDDIGQVVKIGIAFGGPVDSQEGIVGTPFPAPNLPFNNYQLRSAIEVRFKELVRSKYGEDVQIYVEVHIYNDAKAAALGEFNRGGRRGKHGAVVVLGTGTNAAVVSNGEFFSDDGALLELGFNLVKDGRNGQWGFTGFETRGDKPAKNTGDQYNIDLFSGPGIAKQFVEIDGAEELVTSFVNFENTFRGTTPKEFLEFIRSASEADHHSELYSMAIYELLLGITRAVQRNNPVALSFVQQVGEDLGASLAALVENYYDEPWVEHIVLVGSVGEHFAKIPGLKGENDIFVRAIRDGLRMSLSSLIGLEDFSLLDEERISLITHGIERSSESVSWRREVLGAKLTLKDIHSAAIIPQEVRERYRIIRQLEGGGSSAGTYLVRDEQDRVVVLKFATWSGIGSNGKPWLVAQYARLKDLKENLPEEGASKLPEVYDYYEADNLVYYTLEYLEGGVPLSIYHLEYDTEGSAEDFIEDLDDMLTLMAEQYYAQGRLPLPEGYVERVHTRRLDYRLRLLREREGPVFERLIKDRPFKFGNGRHRDIASLFEEVWGYDSVTINGQEFTNSPALLDAVRNSPNVLRALSPSYLPRFAHGDGLLRNFMKMPDGSIHVFDVRGVDLPDNSPARIDIPYELGKFLHGIFLEIIRSDLFKMKIERGDDGKLNFELVYDTNDPRVQKLMDVRMQMPQLFYAHPALNRVLADEPDWLKKALYAEATHFLADAVNRLEQDLSGRHTIAYYLLGTMLMDNVIDGLPRSVADVRVQGVDAAMAQKEGSRTIIKAVDGFVIMNEIEWSEGSDFWVKTWHYSYRGTPKQKLMRQFFLEEVDGRTVVEIREFLEGDAKNFKVIKRAELSDGPHVRRVYQVHGTTKKYKAYDQVYEFYVSDELYKVIAAEGMVGTVPKFRHSRPHKKTEILFRKDRHLAKRMEGEVLDFAMTSGLNSLADSRYLFFNRYNNRVDLRLIHLETVEEVAHFVGDEAFRVGLHDLRDPDKINRILKSPQSDEEAAFRLVVIARLRRVFARRYVEEIQERSRDPVHPETVGGLALEIANQIYPVDAAMARRPTEVLSRSEIREMAQVRGNWVRSIQYENGTIERLDQDGRLVWTSIYTDDGVIDIVMAPKIHDDGKLRSFEIWYNGKRADYNLDNENRGGLIWELKESDESAGFEFLKSHLQLREIHIYPDVQGQGIGSAVLQWIMQHALANGYRHYSNNQTKNLNMLHLHWRHLIPDSVLFRLYKYNYLLRGEINDPTRVLGSLGFFGLFREYRDELIDDKLSKVGGMRFDEDGELAFYTDSNYGASSDIKQPRPDLYLIAYDQVDKIRIDVIDGFKLRITNLESGESYQAIASNFIVRINGEINPAFAPQGISDLSSSDELSFDRDKAMTSRRSFLWNAAVAAAYCASGCARIDDITGIPKNPEDLKIPDAPPPIAPRTPSNRQNGFYPPNDNVLLFIGQDPDTFDDYANNFGVPAGAMSYTDLNFDGLETANPLEGGGGVNHAQHYIDYHGFESSTNKGNDVALQIGLYLVWNEFSEEEKASRFRAIINGEHDAKLDEFADYIISTGVPVYLRIGYEGDSSYYNYNPDLYKAAFRHIVERLRAQGARFDAVWHSAAESTLDQEHMDRFYPGDDVVDWVGASLFGMSDTNAWFDQRAGGRLLAQFAKDHGKRFMIAEASPHGMQTPGEKEDWLRKFFDFMNEGVIKDVLGAASYIPWNWGAFGAYQNSGLGDHRLDQDVNPGVVRIWRDSVYGDYADRYLHSSDELLEAVGYFESTDGAMTADAAMARDRIRAGLSKLFRRPASLELPDFEQMSTEEIVAYNIEKILSDDFSESMGTESMSGNAGSDRQAIHGYVNRKGAIMFFGNPQNVRIRAEQIGIDLDEEVRAGNFHMFTVYVIYDLLDIDRLELLRNLIEEGSDAYDNLNGTINEINLLLENGRIDALTFRLRSSKIEDAAMTALGGIDLNPDLLEIEERGEGVEFDLPKELEKLETMPINGFSPIIYQIVPVTNLPLLLGIVDEDGPELIADASDESYQLSKFTRRSNEALIEQPY